LHRLIEADSREARMHAVLEALWPELRRTNVSWAGFYIDHPDQPDDRRMVLGSCRDKPACSPIGLHGVCGKALLSREVKVVNDVRELGTNYIACDPHDQSEIVIPLIDEDACWGVFDLDSYSIGAFDEQDASGLLKVLAAARLIDSAQAAR
jgi:L-methionine (R)-S-oxide reductase